MGKYVSIREGASALPEQSVAHMTHDLIYQSGVLDLAADHLKVSEHNPQNRSVDVADGRSYYKKTTVTYHGYVDTNAVTASPENVAIAANNTGNPRKDAVVAYIDTAASANADASNVLKLQVVQGEADPSPTIPSDGDIQSDIGSGKPFIRLANVTVADGATVITNADIEDTRPAAYVRLAAGLYNSLLLNSKMGGNYHQVKQLTGSGTIDLDCAVHNVFEITKSGDITLTISNMQVGQYIQIDTIQNGTGGYDTTWFASIKWPDNVVPTETQTANKRDSFVIKKIATNSYVGYIAGQNL